ncbi:hypothetical protein CCP3SC5AM1_70010 [Gammaproteobacteria bacterium]
MINLEKKSDLLAIGTLINFIICNLFMLVFAKWIIFWLILFILIEIMIIGRKHIKPIMTALRRRTNSDASKTDCFTDSLSSSSSNNDATTSSSLPPPAEAALTEAEALVPRTIESVPTTVAMKEAPMVPMADVPRPLLAPHSVASPSLLLGALVSLPTEAEKIGESSLKTTIIPSPLELTATEFAVPVLIRPYIESKPRSLITEVAISSTVPVIAMAMPNHSHEDTICLSRSIPIVDSAQPFDQSVPRPLITVREPRSELTPPLDTSPLNPSVNIDKIAQLNLSSFASPSSSLEVDTEIEPISTPISDSATVEKSYTHDVQKATRPGRKERSSVKRRGIRLKSLPPNAHT